MAPIHVDESAGSDETGKGTPEQPYQTLAFALYSHPEEKFVIRKDAAGTYEEPTQSALKKAKKGADGIEKKRKKAEELAAREANEKKEARERRERQLEESKKIVLTEDASLPPAKKVRSRRLILVAFLTHLSGFSVKNWQPCIPSWPACVGIWMGTPPS